MSRLRARIIGTGSHLPEKRLTNHDLARMVDTSDEWIFSRTGIRERRIAAEGEYTSDLAAQAGRNAIQAAGIDAATIDLILVATTTPDLIFPSTASIVQHKLGLSHTRMPAFDVQAVCAGFMHALSVADQFIRAGSCWRVLVIGAETASRIIDWNDRGTCILFGDGAGAVLLEAELDGERGLLSTHLHADGSQIDLLLTDGGISRGPAPGGGMGVIRMQGNEVFKQAVKAMESCVDETLAANQISKEQVDWLVPHQANIRIIQGTAKRLGMPMERVAVTVDRHGNTSAASVPLALDEVVRDGRIQAGQRVMMVAFGGGFTWGSALVRW
ncbi:3-oxoacyl-[acyl-carrier-protein] synthase 3 protein 1 [Candidatus Magnetaquicoccaceae bacterium FCR-1]|uniref:Beta-ketoacyl-[acyl-carrier-protein] synthase III n=1 Tax=Candidatus Magnetaquiglobus chichijimensis TaxID=3141448 RepID=A0ABQ0CA24_9PROT